MLNDFYVKFAKSPVKNPGGRNPSEYSGRNKYKPIPKNHNYINDSQRHYNTINDVSRRLMEIEKNKLRA